MRRYRRNRNSKVQGKGNVNRRQSTKYMHKQNRNRICM